MTNPSNPKSAGDDRNLVPVDEQSAVAFEDKLHVFWRKNGGVVLGLCVAILAGILAKGAWEMYQRKQQAEVGQAYAAATTPEELKAFAAANAGSELAGIAYLRIADEAYAAGNASEAVSGYDQALKALEDGPLVARAQVGQALAKAQAGQAAEAVEQLKKLADDAAQLDAVRAEAAYHVASLAAQNGNVAEAQKYIAQVTQANADPQTNPWSMRAMMLQMNLLAAPAAQSPTPSETAPKAEDSASAPIRLPGK